MKQAQHEDSGESKQKWGYPYFPLSSSLKVSDAVKELGGARSEIPKSVLARHLNETEKSPTFSQRVTTAKTFGLIQGHGAYALSDIAKRYYFPTNESDKSAALLEIFASPPAFKELLRRFDGDKLPSREILGNILHRELGVPESWMERVAGFFVNSAQTVGVTDGQGFLRFNAAKYGTSSSIEVELEEGDVEHLEERHAPVFKDNLIGKGVSVWVHKGIRLETPEALDSESWKALKSYVETVIKPKEAPKRV